MNAMVLMWTVGVIHLMDAAVNLALPRKLRCRESLAGLPPIMRQIFIVHWLYILIVLVMLGLACLLFAPELASGSPLARFLCGCMALFWLIRVPIQLLYFDPQLRREHRWADLAFTVSALFMGAVFAAGALGWLR